MNAEKWGIQVIAPSCRPFGTAGLWRESVPRVSPGAIFIGSLREPPAVGRRLAFRSQGVRRFPPIAKNAMDGAPGNTGAVLTFRPA
jgi:hypothetical protein